MLTGTRERQFKAKIARWSIRKNYRAVEEERTACNESDLPHSSGNDQLKAQQIYSVQGGWLRGIGADLFHDMTLDSETVGQRDSPQHLGELPSYLARALPDDLPMKIAPEQQVDVNSNFDYNGTNLRPVHPLWQSTRFSSGSE